MAEYSLGMRVEYGGVQLVPCPACAHLLARNGLVKGQIF